MGTEKFDDTDFEDIDMDDNGSFGETNFLSHSAWTKATKSRRRLEEWLEQQRLKRQLSDYEFDD